MAYSAALKTVYNHYLKSYPQMRPSRHDAHKRDELRSVYNAIIEQNRVSPLFLLDDVTQSLEFAVGLKESARELQNAINSLGGLDEAGILNKKTAFSSNPDIASAIFIGEDESPIATEGFHMTVECLAAGQVNSGYALAQAAPCALPVGSYSFDLNLADTSYEFQFNINEYETNLDVQKRLLRLFDNAELGITAKIEQDANGNGALSLSSNSVGLPPGRDVQFSISDDKSTKSTGAVSYLGLDNVSKSASDAHFTINGVPKTAQSNHFTVERMFEVRLNGSGGSMEQPIHIGLKSSRDSVGENIGNLIDSYNTFLQTAAAMDEHPGGRRAIGEMRQIAFGHQKEMEAIGMRLLSDGHLAAMDTEKLTQLLSAQNSPEQGDEPGLFSLRSFSNAVLRKTDQMTLNPMEYVDKKIIAYKNPGASFISPYVTSAYSGMMFNSYC